MICFYRNLKRSMLTRRSWFHMIEKLGLGYPPVHKADCVTHLGRVKGQYSRSTGRSENLNSVDGKICLGLEDGMDFRYATRGG